MAFITSLALVVFIWTRCWDLYLGCLFWLRANCDSHGWLSKAVILKNEQCKQGSRFVGSTGPSVARRYFLDAKEETHGPSESTAAGSNENRPVPLVPIMCDIFDMRLISSFSRSPKLNTEPVSYCYFIFYRTLSLWRPRSMGKNGCLRKEPWSFSPDQL